jgi:hypothetical protein
MQGLPTNPALPPGEGVDPAPLRLRPRLCHGDGRARFDHLLPAYDKDGRRKAPAGLASLLERLEGVGEDGSTPPTARPQHPDQRREGRPVRARGRAPWQYDPNFYIRQAGEGCLDAAQARVRPGRARFENAIRRIEQIPAFFEQATLNLVRVPKPHIAVALLQVDGLSQFLEETFLDPGRARRRASPTARARRSTTRRRRSSRSRSTSRR